MAKVQSEIGFEQLGLGAVLKRYRLLVPPNQRDYAWEKKEVQNLLEDLAAAINDDEPQHFLGTLVTIPRANGVLEVVDGQQRLATTALVLAAMRQISLQGSDNLPKALDAFLTDVDTETLEDSPKMTLNAADSAIFHELLLHGKSQSALPNRDSHTRLVTAYGLSKVQMMAVAKPFSEADRTKAFLRWMKYIEFNARVILLKVPDDVNAFKMFETLNDRGLKVSQSDLVKNYIFGQSAARLAEVQQLWSYVKGALETLDEEDITMTFLRQSLIAMNGYLKETDVYERVQSSVKGAQSSVNFVTELESLANDYVAIASPQSEKWNEYPSKVRASLKVLQLFDLKPFRPLMLAIARRFTVKETALAYERLVAYAVRLIIASTTRSGSVEQPLARAAKQIFDGDIQTAKDLASLLAPIIPSDDLFRQAFEVATVSQAKFARYYLRSIEMSSSGDQDAWMIPNDDTDVINLEHVLPLKPMDNWPSYDEEAVKTYSKRMGNMALMIAKDNSDLKSSAFGDKKAAFAKSPLTTTSMIGSVDEWTPEEIIKRQVLLAQLAVKAWPLK
ncbi:MAG TPA: DUF262 domain-containing HNH endonuclease family protein [Brevundimonas sp.]|uniref:DUF262 domain-containing protein n=1 Tax=Brevundimonas sp. TaxID=1871086 RepID=UPI002626CB8B|nr:DUF262 domain-containing HNH endonuclease family protein [Brevundimonas sp.]HRO32868.1 DUF262 domain-containing HNH endonuclease family protein [Brevundimonas sp.]